MTGKDVQSNLVAALRELRHAEIITTNKDAAEKLKMSEGTFSAYVSGSQRPSKNFISKFQEVFNVDLTKAPGTIKTKAPEMEALAFIDIYAMSRVILSLLAEQEAGRTGQLVGQVFGQIERAIEAEREAKLKALGL